VRRAAATVGKATVVGGRAVTRKVITLSKSDGAAESGLTALIWNQVLSYGADAMVTVALAGTVFFGASAHAQRGNVLLYLLITMAPFAVVAPVIGPALDRLQHGRRWTMAGTAIGRGILALIMAAHSSDLLVLYPCALGSLVLSKAYGVVRAAAAPRLVPPNMSLTAANSRVTIFGLGSTLVLGGFVGVLIKVTGSYTFGLVVTAIGFAACAVFSFRLPSQVDSANAAARHPSEPRRPARQAKVPPLPRLIAWARRGFAPHVVVALQGEASLRLLTGFLTIYLAFYVESTSHGFGAALALAGVVGGAGAGNFVGTALGHRLKTVRPQVLVVGCVCAAAAATLLAAILFSMFVATIAIFLGSATSSLGKIALDSLIQNDVVEALRSSAFGRSETFLQLAWVLGAAIGVALPSNGPGDGTVAFIVATVVVGAAAVVVLLRNRAVGRLHDRHQPGDTRPLGSVAPQSLD
jgi:MFS family permease